MRTTPDVSFDADPDSGVAVYDSYSQGSAAPWLEVGGTSFSSPAWAGLIAIADEVRANHGLPSLDGHNETLPTLVQHLQQCPVLRPTSTTSRNGFNGYSAASGLRPGHGHRHSQGQLLIPDLARHYSAGRQQHAGLRRGRFHAARPVT